MQTRYRRAAVIAHRLLPALDAGAFNDFEKNWFASEAETLEWQRENGGYLVRYGEQAVTLLKRE